jgi:hypothetical protein
MLQIEWTPRGGTLQLLEFDAVETETGEASTEVTEHAVEEGAVHHRPRAPRRQDRHHRRHGQRHPVVVPGTAMDGATGGTSSVPLGAGGGR